MVWYETHGTACTHGFLLFCHLRNLTKAAGMPIDVHLGFNMGYGKTRGFSQNG